MIQVVTGHKVTWTQSDPLVAALFVVWQFFYFGYSWAVASRSFGMYVLGLRLVRADGTEIAPRQGVLRALVFPLSFLLLGLGFLGILVQHEHRALHDLIAGTTVVYAWDARAARLRFLARAAEIGAARPPAASAGAPADRAADGPADRAADGPADRAADGPADRAADGPADRAADGPADRAADGPADRAADGPADRAADGPADRAADGRAAAAGQAGLPSAAPGGAAPGGAAPGGAALDGHAQPAAGDAERPGNGPRDPRP